MVFLDKFSLSWCNVHLFDKELMDGVQSKLWEGKKPFKNIHVKLEKDISRFPVKMETFSSDFRSSPRSFLRFGKRSAPKYDVDNDYESLGDNPDFQAIVVKKGGDNYLRFALLSLIF